MDEWISVAKGEIFPHAGIKQGVESLQIALSVLESARNGQVVNIG